MKPIRFNASQVPTFLGYFGNERLHDAVRDLWRKHSAATYASALRAQKAQSGAVSALTREEETHALMQNVCADALAEISKPAQSIAEVAERKATVASALAQVLPALALEQQRAVQAVCEKQVNTRYGTARESSVLARFGQTLPARVSVDPRLYSKSYGGFVLQGRIDGWAERSNAPDANGWAERSEAPDANGWAERSDAPDANGWAERSNAPDANGWAEQSEAADNPLREIVEIKNRVHRLFHTLRDYERVQLQIYFEICNTSSGYLVEAHGEEMDFVREERDAQWFRAQVLEPLALVAKRLNNLFGDPSCQRSFLETDPAEWTW